MNRLAAMHLSPVPRRVPTKNSKGKSVTWNDKELVVTRLLTETSALIEIFDQMAMRLGPNVELKHPTVPHIEPIVIPESKWNAMLTDSCNLLEEKLLNFRPHEHKSRLEIMDAWIWWRMMGFVCKKSRPTMQNEKDTMWFQWMGFFSGNDHWIEWHSEMWI